MAKVVVVTSGKGGVGKTTSTAALGAALAQFGQNVVVVDFDVGLRNLDLVMGAERRVVYDLINVTQGIAKLPQALIRDKRLERLALLPASQTRDKDALTEDGVARVINSLKQMFDWVICDSPAGIERGATLAMRFADTAIVVTNPKCRRCAIPIASSAFSTPRRSRPSEASASTSTFLFHATIPRAPRAGKCSASKTSSIFCRRRLLGIIPESEEVLRASNLGSPVTFNNPSSAPARAYLDAARRLMGEEVEMTVPTEKQGFFGKLFGRRAA
jgi:septum site-determining protein MinD